MVIGCGNTQVTSCLMLNILPKGRSNWMVKNASTIKKYARTPGTRPGVGSAVQHRIPEWVTLPGLHRCKASFYIRGKSITRAYTPHNSTFDGGRVRKYDKDGGVGEESMFCMPGGNDSGAAATPLS